MFACPIMCKWVTVYQQKDITHQYQKLFNRISRKRTPTMRKIGGRLQEQNHKGSLPTRGPDTAILWKIVH